MTRANVYDHDDRSLAGCESGPGGRPAIGPAISVKVPEEMLAAIDAAAGVQEIARAEWIRRACAAALAVGHSSPVTTAIYAAAADDVADEIAAAVAR